MLGTSASSRALNGSATASFENTLELPLDVDVFNLPEGYTANAGTYLVNNRFVPTALAPEPASGVLITLGLLALALGSRRRMLR